MRIYFGFLLKSLLLSLFWVSVAGCTSIKKELYCKISDTDIEKLQYSTHQFLEAKWGKQAAACEEVSKTITYLSKYGCAIYGSPKFEKNGPCPLTTDADYWVTFDKTSLSPHEIIEISY